MAELEDHIALMEKQRAALLSQIDALHEGDRKATLLLMLEQIDSQLQQLKNPQPKVSGKAKVPFTPGRDKATNR